MIGIGLMALGVVIFVAGLVLFLKSGEKEIEQVDNKNLDKVIEMAVADGVLTANEKKLIKQLADEKNLDSKKIFENIEQKLSSSKVEAETEIINRNKKNGDEFEKFVVTKFSKQYFTVKEWAGDKYVNGTFAKTTQQPDLLLEFAFKDIKHDLFVECKWRKKLYKNGVELAKVEQIKRYKDIQKQKNTPVFIALGIGGTGNLPEQLYIIPLQDIDSNFMSINRLNKYKKSIDSKFFFDSKTKTLR